MGRNIRVPFDTSKSVTENSEPGNTFLGEPTCSFRVKIVPDLIACSKKGSITSDILQRTFQDLINLVFTSRHPIQN